MVDVRLVWSARLLGRGQCRTSDAGLPPYAQTESGSGLNQGNVLLDSPLMSEVVEVEKSVASCPDDMHKW